MTDCFEKRKERRDSQRGSDDGECAGRRIPDIVIVVIDIRTHGGNHRGKPRSLGKVRNNFTSLHSGIVVLVNEKRLNDNEDLVHVRAYQVIELKENPVDDLD